MMWSQIVFFLHLVLPLASPFANARTTTIQLYKLTNVRGGSSSSSQNDNTNYSNIHPTPIISSSSSFHTTTSRLQQQQQQQQESLRYVARVDSTVPPPPISIQSPLSLFQATTTSTTTSLHSIIESTAENDTSRSFWWRFRKSRRNQNHSSVSMSQSKMNYDNNDTIIGEYGSSLLSRWLYNYVNPLLHIAAHRQLDTSDAFPIPDHRQMTTTASSLARIYNNKIQLDQHKDTVIPATNTTTTTTNADPLLLTIALLQQQRRTIISTGLLRLFNTLIQAFPALLVARLLRLIETGIEQPAPKALWAALHLVLILSIKMIVENQYFHSIVKCSTSVRGSLASLIFEKSLRLPNGGGDVQPINFGRNTKKRSAIIPSNSFSNSTKTVPITTTVPSSLGAGGVLNLMQSDCSIIESAAMQLHTIWDAPLQIAIYTTLLYRYMGSSVLWGMTVLLLTIPLNSITLRILNQLSRYENEAKDARTKRTAESIRNMKLLKLQNWEQCFAEDIRQHRSVELQRHVSRGIIRAINSAISNAVPAIVLVVTLTAYVKTGRPIVASTIFTAISLFNQLRFPLFFYPMLIDSLANGRNAMRRIATFLAAEENRPYVEYLPVSDNDSGGGGGGSIVMQHGNFVWTTSASNTTNAVPALVNVEVMVQSSEIVAVIGSVGGGKSALIKGLIGELHPVSTTTLSQLLLEQSYRNNNRKSHQALDSHISVQAIYNNDQPPTKVISRGEIAYCSQEAWLPKGTIREAITFGRDYDAQRYHAALYDAGLDEDIINVDNDDCTNSSSSSSTNFNPISMNSGLLRHDTDVGEGGSSLSGGQRARVALARALYCDNDSTKVFVLDDILAALDSRVGAMVFERITKRLRQSKAATILVTNDPSIPRRCDRVILMGKVPGSASCSYIVDEGSYDDLLARGHDLQSISAADNNNDYADDGNRMHSDLSLGTVLKVSSNTSSVGNVTNEMNVGTQGPVRVVGSCGSPSNATEWCYGPVDCENEALLENCPDYIGDQTVVRRIPRYFKDSTEEEHDTDGILFPVNMSQTYEADTNVRLDLPLSTTVPKRISSADDSMSVGAVPRSVYISYFKSVRSPWLVLAMLSSYVLSNGAQFFQQYTVVKWTEVGGTAIGQALGIKYLRSLVNAAGVVSIFLWVRSFLTMKVGVRASEFLHSRMLSSVFSAPMLFFDATPSGQLLSRFGKEMQTIDSGVPDSIGSVLFCFLQIALSVGALAGIITPVMVLPLGIVGLLYVKMMGRFRPAARDMKRVETKTRSPIYTHFGEAIRGAETIRTFRGARELWIAKHQQLQDRNLGVFTTVKALDRWLSTRLETLGNTVVLTAAIASVILTRTGQLKAGSAGWGLTQSLAITGLLTWAVRCLTDLESNMMSVMRVKELTDLDSNNVSLDMNTDLAVRMPKELSMPGEALKPLLSRLPGKTTLAPLDSDAIIKSGWPWRGTVQFKNISMRYSPDAPLVLKRINLTVPAGTTLGIVGRTGSGKSSIFVALYRLCEIESNGGAIEIDGVDTRSVSMEALRQSLAIIPQDPVLFTGTIAYNLDATGKSSPEDMLKALKAASPNLAEYFQNADGLDTHIAEGGKNLSLGQRQLICLARALLRKSKILLMDEATSSVDAKTDQEVQDTIRREFVERGVSVITVAHRLDTILSYDRIAVLGDGEVMEYGSPKDLVGKKGGEFQKLIQADKQNKQKGGMKPTRDTKSPLLTI